MSAVEKLLSLASQSGAGLSASKLGASALAYIFLTAVDSSKAVVVLSPGPGLEGACIVRCKLGVLVEIFFGLQAGLAPLAYLIF